ncbi:MAG TPA: helix-turn-helix domain-containing protein, partial [Pyrinomonadaceae bacterium]|nr:helix-turn-helix domain-containing protein [Pyrinomonadaceae bacterium]
RALILSSGSFLELDSDLSSLSAPHVMSGISESAVRREPSPSVLSTLEEVERAHICAVLRQARGVIEGASGAAKTLGMHPNTLRHRMQKLGIKRSTHRLS